MDQQTDRRWRRLTVGVAIAVAFTLLLFATLAVPALAQDDDGEGETDSPFATNVVTTTTTANVNLRAAPGLSADILQVVPAGTVVGFTGFMDGSGDWIQVDPVDAPVGWMHRTLLASVPDGLQVRPADAPEEEAEVDFATNVVTGTTQFNVYLRSAPMQSFNILTTLQAGTVVGFTGFTDGTGNWVQVDPVGAPVGWVWGEYLSNVPTGLQVRPADAPEDGDDDEEGDGEDADGQTPSVTVRDQEMGDGNTVSIPQVVAADDGWLVIHVDDEGAPGAVIGQTAVDAGTNENVNVEIDRDMATDRLYAMLHVDAGEMGVYEFPGADGPVRVDGNVVVRPFTITDFVEEEEAPFGENVVTTTTTANVNLREAPGLNSTIIQVVPNGTVVGFTGFMDATGEWVQVDPVGAPVGWMHSSLLAFVPDGLQVAETD